MLEATIVQYRPALVIIDPLMRSTRVRNSNAHAEMTRVMELLMSTGRLYGADILRVHHADKDGREGALLPSFNSGASVLAIYIRYPTCRVDKHISRGGAPRPEPGAA